MSKIIEINKDNCILTELEIKCLDISFDFVKKHKPELKEGLNLVFLKINMLNELAKTVTLLEVKNKYRIMAKNVITYINNLLWESEGQIMLGYNEEYDINKIITTCFTTDEVIKEIY
jgi:hypothetical protein